VEDTTAGGGVGGVGGASEEAVQRARAAAGRTYR